MSGLPGDNNNSAYAWTEGRGDDGRAREIETALIVVIDVVGSICRAFLEDSIVNHSNRQALVDAGPVERIGCLDGRNSCEDSSVSHECFTLIGHLESKGTVS